VLGNFNIDYFTLFVMTESSHCEVLPKQSNKIIINKIISPIVKRRIFGYRLSPTPPGGGGVVKNGLDSLAGDIANPKKVIHTSYKTAYNIKKS